MSELSEAITQLYNDGLSYREIAKELNCSKGTIAYHLSEGQKEKTAARQRLRRSNIEKYLKAYKELSGCVDCKEHYPYYMLAFDHLPEHNKEFGLADYKKFTISLERIKEEVTKCEVVCANCHTIRTHIRQSGGTV